MTSSYPDIILLTVAENRALSDSNMNISKARTALPLIPMINAFVLLLTLGFSYYSQVIYQKQLITEKKEKERLALMKAKHPAPEYVKFDPIMINIASNPRKPSPLNNSQQIEGKLHYVTVALAVELKDEHQRAKFEEIRPIFLDKVIELVGKKEYHELTQMQGRYILRSQILEIANDLMTRNSRNHRSDPKVLDALFTQFIVQ